MFHIYIKSDIKFIIQFPVLFLIVNCLYAQKGIQVEYEVLYAESNPLVEKNEILPTYVILNAFGNKVKLEEIYDIESNERIVRYYSLNDKFYVSQYIDGKFKVSYLNERTKYQITRIDTINTYTVLDYACKKAFITNSSNRKVEIFFTEELQNVFCPFSNLSGLSLVYKFQHPVFKEVVFRAKKVSFVQFDRKFFKRPKVDMSKYASKSKSREGSKVSPAKSNYAPFVIVKDLSNNKVPLYFNRGKITVLYFWKIDNPSSIKEIPRLNILKEKYSQNDQVQFISIANNSINSVRNFLLTQDFYYEKYGNGFDAIIDFDVDRYPTNILINENGEIIFKNTGYSSMIAYNLDLLLEKILREE